jgi:predicted HTH domain antitoxin
MLIADVTVTLDIPDAIARELGGSPHAIARELLEDAAAEGYRSGKLSHFQVRTILGFSAWTETEQFLRNRGIPLNYGEADLEQDRQNAQVILKEK